MSLTNQKALLPKVARQVFENATVTSLGQNLHTIIMFHLKQKSNRDPCEVLISDPKTFYSGLEESLGTGPKAACAR